MKVRIIPEPEFQRQAKRLSKKYASLKNDLAEFSREVSENPFTGKDLGGNTRKVRLAITSKGKGKSGGARIITYLTEQSGEEIKVRLLTIYDKSEIESLSTNFIQSLIRSICS